LYKYLSFLPRFSVLTNILNFQTNNLTETQTFLLELPSNPNFIKMAPILNGSPLAALSFADGNGAHIRVYYQATDGSIKETFYDDKKGWALRSVDVIGKAKLNAGIAGCAWANGTQVSPIDIPDSIKS
jgi:hypothetical protein